jgi:glycosyltransferase involved in cell wall biosynthesis
MITPHRAKASCLPIHCSLLPNAHGLFITEEDEVKVSIIMPAYNEAATIAEMISKVQAVDVGFPKEIIIVDDASIDGTRDVLNRFCDVSDVRVVFHERNRGKGAAIRTALAQVKGDIVVIQDADLEYDPEDIPRLIRPIVSGKADVVYGNRFHGEAHRVLYFWHSVGNGVLTLLCNMLTNLNLNDMEVGYKAFRADVICHIRLRSDRFGFEPEVTAKVAKMGCRLSEVPISYYGRTYAEGKKITWKDGVAALWCMLRYRIVD